MTYCYSRFIVTGDFTQLLTVTGEFTLYAGVDSGEGGWGVHPARAPPKIGKNMIFLR